MLFPLGRAGRRDAGGRRRLRRPRPARRRRRRPPRTGSSGAPIAQAAFWKRIERDLVDHLARSRALDLPVNRDLKLYGRPGETDEEFATRCAQVADEQADAEMAKLRDKYEAKATTLRGRLDAASDSAEVATEQHKARRARRPAVVGRLDPRRPARRAALARRPARPARPGRRSALQDRRRRRAGRGGPEQGRPARVRARRPRSRAGRGAHRDRRPVDGQGQADHDGRHRAGAHRRQGDPPRAGLDPDPLTSPGSALSEQPARAVRSVQNGGRVPVEGLEPSLSRT